MFEKFRKKCHKRREHQLKLVVVGDAGCGKTSLLATFINGEFPVGNVPTISESTTKCLTIGKDTVRLSLSDKTGEPNYKEARMVYYLETAVVLICFSVDDPDSLRNAEEEWKPEVAHFCPTIPYILVGTKSELRNDLAVLCRLAAADKSSVSYNDGLHASHRIGAYKYVECSAKNLAGIQAVFDTAARAALRRAKRTVLERFCQTVKNNLPSWMGRACVVMRCY